MKISILIPTYNRSKFLIKNLKHLTRIIKENNFTTQVEIIVSNNCSTDDTHSQVANFLKKSSRKISISYYKRKTNTGLEQNALFTLSKATAEYVMFIGDDDYIDEKYLIKILKEIKHDSKITAIIPSIQAIDIYGNKLQQGRDLKKKNQQYRQGFFNCLCNSWRGHQLSGLLFKRKGLLLSYKTNFVSNIYPFIYFLSYSCFRGKTLHITDYPVLVTTPGIDKKDWNYGKDGLVTEVFNNYSQLGGLPRFKKSILQIYFLYVQKWRYLSYLNQNFLSFFRACWIILKAKDTLWLTKIFFLPLCIIAIISSMFKKSICFIKK